MTTEGLQDNDNLFFVDVPSNVPSNDDNDLDIELERRSQGLQAPPVRDTTEALIDDDENAAALAELEDVPMAAKRKRTINRGPKLDTKRLLSARGLPAISSCFKDVKLKGKGHEEDDLSLIMSTLEHWAHRLYPRLTFDDCLEKIESLGQKREIQTCLKKIRMGMPIIDDDQQTTVITNDGPPPDEAELEPIDDDVPSTSHIDIFPVRTTSRRLIDDAEEESPESSRPSTSAPSTSLAPATDYLNTLAGFNPADFS